MRVLDCPRCGEETVVRMDLAVRRFLTPGPKLIKTPEGTTMGVICTCGNYVAYGHLEGDQFVIDRETA